MPLCGGFVCQVFVKCSKVVLCQKKLLCLGHQISPKGIEANPAKLGEIPYWPRHV